MHSAQPVPLGLDDGLMPSLSDFIIPRAESQFRFRLDGLTTSRRVQVQSVLKRTMIKQCRRIATRYDKLAANYLAFVELPRSAYGCAFMSSRPRLTNAPIEQFWVSFSTSDDFQVGKVERARDERL